MKWNYICNKMRRRLMLLPKKRKLDKNRKKIELLSRYVFIIRNDKLLRVGKFVFHLPKILRREKYNVQASTSANKTPPNSNKVDLSNMMKIKEEEETPPICHIRAPTRKPSNPIPIDVSEDSDFDLPKRQTPQNSNVNSRSIGAKSKVN